MNPSRISKFRFAASTLGLVSLGGASVRAVSRLFREGEGNQAGPCPIDREVVSTASAVRIAVRPSSPTSKVRRTDNFPDYFAALLRTRFAERPAARSTALML
jgi:hypothetical protein